MIQQILIPVDFSETSAAAAEYGCELAAQLGAHVTLLNVFTAGIVATPDAVFMPSPEELDALQHAAHTHLQSVAAKLEREGLSIECVAVEGAAADVICAYAERHAIQLIVMGTHGRRGISHLLLGSVAEHVLRHGPCPVLTIGRASAQPSHAVAP